jgi:hypothetical protein
MEMEMPMDDLYRSSNIVRVVKYRLWGIDMQFIWGGQKCIQNFYGETYWNVTICKTGKKA